MLIGIISASCFRICQKALADNKIWQYSSQQLTFLSKIYTHVKDLGKYYMECVNFKQIRSLDILVINLFICHVIFRFVYKWAYMDFSKGYMHDICKMGIHQVDPNPRICLVDLTPNPNLTLFQLCKKSLPWILTDSFKLLQPRVVEDDFNQEW